MLKGKSPESFRNAISSDRKQTEKGFDFAFLSEKSPERIGRTFIQIALKPEKRNSESGGKNRGETRFNSGGRDYSGE